ncbi:hypothetical protein [Thioalkalivibrio sp. AKL10]|uniref:hypothetical protein n=1 Tax=Thioalkalivibrio sp. AKL10 TaxID=1158158 RepID=UPI0012DCF773|nr:hypothetical protein [Thioalkalivibrio sp. AKL10]
MPHFELIDISWSQCRPVAYNEHAARYELDASDDVRLNECGFYCIYGAHPVYGPNVLLYIGETTLNDNNQRSFATRFGEHFKGRFWFHQNLSYSTGLPSTQLSGQEIRLVESILIAAHKPALNRHSIDSAAEGSEKYLVRNWDFPGVLQFECSGGYWRQ